MRVKFFCATELEAKIYPQAFVHGIGILETALNIDLQDQPDMAIQFGICGVYPEYASQYPVGSVVVITQDTLGDLGSSSPEGFLKPSDMNLNILSQFKSTATIPKVFSELPRVKALTVQRCTGTQEIAFERQAQFDVQVESMEGSAFLRVCQKAKVPSLQIRAISNVASTRDFESWDIPLALENLKKELEKWI